MVISHKYRFIFVKTRKTAGTSIEVYLSELCDDRDIFTPITPQAFPHRARNYRGLFNPIPEVRVGRGQAAMRDWLRQRRFYHHIPASVMRHRISRSTWDQYFKFCVERNPWDKTISHYYSRRQRLGIKSFDEYLEQDVLCHNHPLYTDRHGRPLVDRVLHYERLEEDLREVFRSLGVPFSGRLPVRAKSDKRRDRRPYGQVYSDRQRRLIEKAFAFEISLHGYRF